MKRAGVGTLGVRMTTMPKYLHYRRAGLMAGALLLSAAVAPPLAADNLFVSSTNTKSVISDAGVRFPPIADASCVNIRSWRWRVF